MFHNTLRLSEILVNSRTGLLLLAMMALMNAAAQNPTRDGLSTPDLAFFDLHGNVRTCTSSVYYMYADTITFTKDGTLQTQLERRITRNPQGQIVTLTDTQPDEMDDEYYSTTYEWDAYGRLAKEIEDTPEGTATSQYFYDARGLMVKRHTTGFLGDDVDQIVTYTYKAFDQFGNWTERETVLRDLIFEGENITETERRIITYYE